ncbi:MAG: hypothetical protein HY875_00585 [Chloroflexi bacterium]|nr:hypothetical protein [Chloroflexota bacterium]
MNRLIRRLRQHHAIEHATVAVLFERRGRCKVFGLSDFGGFTLAGPFAAEDVQSAAAEAIARLQSGQSNLAVTDLCGTTLVTTAALAAVGALAGAGNKRVANLPRAITFAVAGVALAPAAGRWLQRTVTTDASVEGLAIGKVAELGGTPARRRVRVNITAAG